jgi:hypothetical protein
MFNILVPFGSWYIMITSSGVDHLMVELLVYRRYSKIMLCEPNDGRRKIKIAF